MKKTFQTPSRRVGRLAARSAGNPRVHSFAASGSGFGQYLIWARYARETFGPDAMAFGIQANDFWEAVLRPGHDVKSGFHYFDEEEDGTIALRRVDYRPSLLRRLLRWSALARMLVGACKNYVAINMGVHGKWQLAQYFTGAKKLEFIADVPRQADPQKMAESLVRELAFLDRLPAFAGLTPDRILFVVAPLDPHGDATSSGAGSYFDVNRSRFLANVTRRGYEAIDLQPIFADDYLANAKRFDFPTDGHWNSRAHALIAEAVIRSRTFAGVFGTAATSAHGLEAPTNLV